MLSLLLSACALECDLMGYLNTLTLHVSRDDGGAVESPTGTVTVGDTTVDFDCAVAGEGYTCSGADVVVTFSGEGADVDYEVHMPSWVAAGNETPAWTVSEPNGKGCGTQYVGALDVVLLATP